MKKKVVSYLIHCERQKIYEITFGSPVTNDNKNLLPLGTQEPQYIVTLPVLKQCWTTLCRAAYLSEKIMHFPCCHKKYLFIKCTKKKKKSALDRKELDGTLWETKANLVSASLLLPAWLWLFVQKYCIIDKFPFAAEMKIAIFILLVPGHVVKVYF